VVLSVTEVANPPGCSATLAVTFNVTGCWKGVTESSITLFTDSDGGCCGYPFVQYQEFLVFGYTQGDNLWSGTCSGNVPRSQADDELALLGPASVPGECATVAVEPATWSLLKTRY